MLIVLIKVIYSFKLKIIIINLGNQLLFIISLISILKALLLLAIILFKYIIYKKGKKVNIKIHYSIFSSLNINKKGILVRDFNNFNKNLNALKGIKMLKITYKLAFKKANYKQSFIFI